MKIKEQVRELEPLLVKIRRHFHQYPELSNQETGTMEQICTYLEEWGIEYQKGVADTGVVAIIRGGRPGRTAALREISTLYRFRKPMMFLTAPVMMESCTPAAMMYTLQ